MQTEEGVTTSQGRSCLAAAATRAPATSSRLVSSATGAAAWRSSIGQETSAVADRCKVFSRGAEHLAGSRPSAASAAPSACLPRRCRLSRAFHATAGFVVGDRVGGAGHSAAPEPGFSVEACASACTTSRKGRATAATPRSPVSGLASLLPARRFAGRRPPRQWCPPVLLGATDIDSYRAGGQALDDCRQLWRSSRVHRASLRPTAAWMHWPHRTPDDTLRPRTGTAP